MQDDLNVPYQPHEFDLYGEAILPNAPISTLSNGAQAVPQQFLHYSRTVKNVEAIVARIHFSDDFPIFVFEENDHVFLQVGIIGHENYPPSQSCHGLHRNNKIVYGRRWYLEPYTPTSEVIQTAFLAINKVREHELRELLSLSLEHNHKQHRSTPFNSHFDLPLAASNADLFKNNQHATNFATELTAALSQFKLGHCQLIVEKVIPISSEQSVAVIRFEDDTQTSFVRKMFPELINKSLPISCNHHIAQALHAMVNTLITHCEAYVAEQFSFDGFHRFSHHITPESLAKFSLDTRLVNDQRTQAFNHVFRNMVHLVDSSKAPPMAISESLAQKQALTLKKREALEGYLPK